ncbi:hypothetical protein N7478_006837 [Penicillium angulare]|uniref:uncharacterized protein n=1 Tax=Penicillium angulare TaxID=116970 RepID=UPI00254219AD|nr:uncharacterized protein N7478_006837 [Penicillium angulare]KAJ5281465.1 hypothetical protein N7478_006837 [Penicillium angulare]
MSLDVYKDRDYIFNRNAQSSVRLNYQHYLITQLTENDVLHKSTKELIDVSTPHRVADVGTGTAIWPLTLARALPHWQVDGFDISGDQYPFAGWVPSNVNLYEHDTFQPYPDEYHGKYDIINIRFMMTLLNKEKYHLLLQNVKALLKPGGILQWLDPIPFNVKAIAPEGMDTPFTSTTAAMWTKTPPDSAEWITLNGDMVKADGYEPVAWEELHFEDFHRPIWNQCSFMCLAEIIENLAQSTDEAVVTKREALRKQLKGWAAECEQGASLDTPWFFIVARKPL